MLAPERHIGSARTRQHVLLVVLAGTGRAACRLSSADHESCNRRYGSPTPTPGTLLAACAFPQRVVAVQHDDLVGFSPQVVEGPEHRGPDRGITLGRVRNVAQAMAVRIGVVLDRIARSGDAEPSCGLSASRRLPIATSARRRQVPPSTRRRLPRPESLGRHTEPGAPWTAS